MSQGGACRISYAPDGSADPAPVGPAPEAPCAVLSTLERDGRRRWMQPVPSTGPWYRRRLAIGWALIALYMALPIAQVGGRPAVLLDVLGREFTVLGQTFYATDTVLLMLLLLGASALVLLGTALLGRVWCGWACPQTVYMELVYRPIEHLLEGVRGARLARAGRWERAARRGAKWALFVLVALALSHTFVAYFAGWESLLRWMTRPPGENAGFFVLMAATTALVLIDFAWFREQMCTIACPYARFQSVLLDEDSLIVSYDQRRGEPRGRRTRGVRAAEGRGLDSGLGDCVDCAACVRTCPTGIDIRYGLQMECIGCTQCIDACDVVMDRVGKPRGLIRYTSERALEGKPTRLLRPRVLAYGGLLALALGALVWVVAVGEALEVGVTRASAEPYVVLQGGEVANRLRFRLHNRTPRPMALDIAVREPAEAAVRLVGAAPIELAPGAMHRVEAWVVAPRAALAGGKVEGRFEVTDALSDAATEARFQLLGPRAGEGAAER